MTYESIPTKHYGKHFCDLNKVYLDFEYQDRHNPTFNMICGSFFQDSPVNFWLHKSPATVKMCKEYLLDLRPNSIMVSWAVIAEASSFISLGVDPRKFAWIDLQMEYRMLLNHWNKYRYGKQLFKTGKKFTVPPKNKWDMTEEDKRSADNSKPESNLAAALYKMLGLEIDTQHKTVMRNLIINAKDDYNFTDKEREDISKYCQSDVTHLPKLWAAIVSAFKDSAAREAIFQSEIALRGKTSARTAYMTMTGYPVHRKSVTKFAGSVDQILNDIAGDINGQFPLKQVFAWNKKTGLYTKKEKPQRDWIAKSPHAANWTLTDGGKKTKPDYSLSLDAWGKHFSYSHNYPRNNFPAQILRYLKTKQSLNGFMPNSKKNFFNFLGGDDRARAYLNPYGSQSSRFQPGAAGFIPLKSAWMRSLIQPRKGKAIAACDYGSQEFLISALLSGDKNMYDSYASGDPYFHFAKLAHAVPSGALRKDHEEIRTLFKSTVLGISYLMGAKNLGHKLSNDTGKPYTQEDAEDLIAKFFKVYNKYDNFILETINAYKANRYLKAADGWVLFGDNANNRSVSNCPIQTFGAAILRKAIELCQLRGLKVIIPLHDALYIEFKSDELFRIDELYDCMREAFSHYFKMPRYDKDAYNRSKAIRQDVNVWGPDFSDGTGETPGGRSFKQQTIYIDERARREYETFKKYF